ncbi:MAG: MASE1 domain-containing protein, partial [Elusimicrobia bacterium]|nr:MASE1 domain-containing protein [Elusimicrobiota bacterium]
MPRMSALAVFVGAYVVAGKLGLSLAVVNPSASPVWPPTGIAIAGLLLLGVSAWPLVLAGAFLVNWTTTWHLPSSVAIAAGNAAEAALGAWLAVCWA